MPTTVELVNSIRQYLLGKYAGKGKDFSQLAADGEMEQGDIEKHQFVLKEMEA